MISDHTIIGEELPPIAYTLKAYWFAEGEQYISSCWLKYNYVVMALKRKMKRIAFVKRKAKRKIQIKIPEKLLSNTISDTVAYEVNNFFSYIIKNMDYKIAQKNI